MRFFPSAAQTMQSEVLFDSQQLQGENCEGSKRIRQSPLAEKIPLSVKTEQREKARSDDENTIDLVCLNIILNILRGNV